MSHRVVITAKAARDDDEMVGWIAQYSPEKAARWYGDFRKAAASLRDFPARCPLARESRPGRKVRQLLFGKHRILFSIAGATVRVLHVRHQKQKPLSPDEL
jgi:plasmid stabilization system protein ParE